MKLTRINANFKDFPEEIVRLSEGARIFDSSSSPEARVYFIDKDDGYFLKTSKKEAFKKKRHSENILIKEGLRPKFFYIPLLTRIFF